MHSICINQSYKNIEIIIINDGSKSEFLQILEKVKNKNPDKIKLFHNQNGGVSSARNLYY